MNDHAAIMQWIDEQQPLMLDLLVNWSNLNTYTFNLDGINQFADKIADTFSHLTDNIERIPAEDYEYVDEKGNVRKKILAPALMLSKRLDAPQKGLFVIHLDTVYPPEESIQTKIDKDKGVLQGQGVVDAKGGIVVMLKALEAFERSPVAKNLGWRVVLNTDEEIGSPGSADFLQKYAKESDIGFVFEPCMANGNLIGSRKGSGNFAIASHGKSAHAGRAPHLGKNAIEPLMKCLLEIGQLNGSREKIIVNVAMINGGSALNIVPDRAVGRFNVRVENSNDQKFIEEELIRIVSKYENLKLYGKFQSPPRIIKGKTLKIYEKIRDSAHELGMKIDIGATGGVSDSNRMEAAGLSTIDSLGVQGDHLHSPDEYMEIKSLTERTKLVTLSLLQWASGEWNSFL
ncbi:MAG: hydrolase [Candidatus Omnitrophica bacterium]|nr:hydrolase [Candidatus Omnitrophota bacterium]MCB9747546.1 hydrolase [Candidatus Omnitrophota bacterium]